MSVEAATSRAASVVLSEKLTAPIDALAEEVRSLVSAAPVKAELLTRIKSVLKNVKHANELIEELLLELRSSKEPLSEHFISLAGHELKTPLTGLQLELYVAQRALEGTGPVPERATARLLVALSQVSRLVTILQIVVDAADIEVGAFRVQREPRDFLPILTDVVTGLGGALEVKEPELLRFDFDATRLRRAISQLVSNGTRHAPETKVDVRASGSAEAVTIEVRDRGPGLENEDLARILAPTDRLQPDQQGPLGLGLFVTRHAIEAHRGTVTVESELGKGTKFIVTLPRGS